MSDDQAAKTVEAMVARILYLFKDVSSSRGRDLVQRLMEIAQTYGFGPESIQTLDYSETETHGIFRDQRHLCAVGGTSMLLGYSGLALMVNTTRGELAGDWIFAQDTDGDLLMSRGGQPCTQVGHLEGPELVEAVITSALTDALTEPLEPEQPKPRRRWWRPFKVQLIRTLPR